MFMLWILSLLAGIVLGQRFRILILTPAILLTLLLTTGAGIARADSAWIIGLSAVMASACLQIGYLAGTGIRCLLVARARGSSTAIGSSMPAGRSLGERQSPNVVS